MHDINQVRENPEAFDRALQQRNAEPAAQSLIARDDARRAAIAKAQALQTTRNDASKKIGQAKGAGDDALAEDLMAQIADLKASLQTAEDEERKLKSELETALAVLPNIALADVPDGVDEADNVEVRRTGEVSEKNAAAEHFEIGEAFGQMDFEAAAMLSGSRFVVLRDDLARLERALGNFMLDLHTTEFGYREINPPVLVRDDAVFGTGQLPKFAEDLFRTENGYWLTPTAEVTLTNLVRDQITDSAELPLRYAALTPCFRSEAGAAGRDTRGMIRQHQFTKCELVSIVEPDQGEEELERLTNCAEEVLKRLGLAYRVMLLCAGDMGFSARKTYDLEVWLPGQNAYREISSCSYCGDFQGRRMNARFRHADAKTTQYVHTLNGSGLAVGRTLVALLENYHQEDGSVLIPEALRPYMGGRTKIEVSK
ncbi:MAG: serine--tRNA ligase [Rhizobiales bacterium TMED143]|nr:serine--tRNA ligase [Rhodobiaceae bacterium]OUV89606.1 MAG: serine--tRNA ligase [Rhizobiales bacterium TMED143]CAI8341203.1 MAG: Serine--tRNA ligase [Rhodobiaceae bacterium UBA7378]HCQ81986.1 serine--tRNA ligase [Rhodobiaceae bacterium]